MAKINYAEKSLALHKKLKGKIEVVSKVPLINKNDLSLAYTPRVAADTTPFFLNQKMGGGRVIKGAAFIGAATVAMTAMTA